MDLQLDTSNYQIPEQSPNVGDKLSDFRILSELGRGSFGVIKKVLSLIDNKEYVMKKITMQEAKPSRQQAAMKEVEILRKMNHPHIIKYYSSFIENSSLYIIMEYADGGDLSQLINLYKAKGKKISERQIWRLAWELCEAIEYLHKHYTMHRDIKTSNIFLTKDGHIKIGDLGVSKIVPKAIPLQGTKIGTPLYLAPELVQELPYDFKVDIWALGCVLYNLMTLRTPFTGENIISLGYNIVHAEPKPLPLCYSARLVKLVLRLLSKNPASRPHIGGIWSYFPPELFPNKEREINEKSPRDQEKKIVSKAYDRVMCYRDNSRSALLSEDKKILDAESHRVQPNHLASAKEIISNYEGNTKLVRGSNRTASMPSNIFPELPHDKSVDITPNEKPQNEKTMNKNVQEEDILEEKNRAQVAQLIQTMQGVQSAQEIQFIQLAQQQEEKHLPILKTRRIEDLNPTITLIESQKVQLKTKEKRLDETLKKEQIEFKKSIVIGEPRELVKNVRSSLIPDASGPAYIDQRSVREESTKDSKDQEARGRDAKEGSLSPWRLRVLSLERTSTKLSSHTSQIKVLFVNPLKKQIPSSIERGSSYKIFPEDGMRNSFMNPHSKTPLRGSEYRDESKERNRVSEHSQTSLKWRAHKEVNRKYPDAKEEKNNVDSEKMGRPVSAFLVANLFTTPKLQQMGGGKDAEKDDQASKKPTLPTQSDAPKIQGDPNDSIQDIQTVKRDEKYFQGNSGGITIKYRRTFHNGFTQARNEKPMRDVRAMKASGYAKPFVPGYCSEIALKDEKLDTHGNEESYVALSPIKRSGESDSRGSRIKQRYIDLRSRDNNSGMQQKFSSNSNLEYIVIYSIKKVLKQMLWIYQKMRKNWLLYTLRKKG